MIVGRYQQGATPFELAADLKLVTRFAFVGPTRIPKIEMYLDGLGSGTGSEQVARGVIYDAADMLLAEGDEIVVVRGQEAGWVDLRFSLVPGGVWLPRSGGYDIGIHAGPATNVIRVFN